VEYEKRGEFMKERGRGKGNKKREEGEREESWRVERCESRRAKSQVWCVGDSNNKGEKGERQRAGRKTR
jgi:hypothetical protein